MTEEIMIDGVNVAGCCKCYNVEQTILCGVSGICANNPNCYYKQLKRLQEKYDTLTNKFFNSETDKTRLEQENKELKEKAPMKLIAKNNKYCSALEEILESAKFAQCLPCGSGNLEDCLNCNDDTTNNGQFCMEKRIQEIKTKCVEVLNDK